MFTMKAAMWTHLQRRRNRICLAKQKRRQTIEFLSEAVRTGGSVENQLDLTGLPAFYAE